MITIPLSTLLLNERLLQAAISLLFEVKKYAVTIVRENPITLISGALIQYMNYV